MKIYVSSAAIKTNRIGDAVKALAQNGFKNIELTGGTQYYEGWKNELKHLKKVFHLNYLIHNYFPPVPQPFVLNLASHVRRIREKSIDYCIKSIDLAHEMGSSFYSVHGGFLIDPPVHQLGKKIGVDQSINRKAGLNYFLKSIKKISDKARFMDIAILIENNVVSHENFNFYQKNPFLMVTPKEIRTIMQNTDKNVFFLLDVGHLKVSSHVLKFNAETLFQECGKWIKAYHLSDNDSLNDCNGPITAESWFWPFLKKNAFFSSIEVYHKNVVCIKNQESLIQSKVNT